MVYFCLDMSHVTSKIVPGLDALETIIKQLELPKRECGLWSYCIFATECYNYVLEIE